jgi:hypothetical protein
MAIVGTWLSLVEHSLGVRGVGSSNLPVPTNFPLHFRLAKKKFVFGGLDRPVTSTPILCAMAQALRCKRLRGVGGLSAQLRLKICQSGPILLFFLYFRLAKNYLWWFEPADREHPNSKAAKASLMRKVFVVSSRAI